MVSLEIYRAMEKRPLDMTQYPLAADFCFRYLGNNGRSDWYMNCQLDYLKVSLGEPPEPEGKPEEEPETEPAAPLSLRYDDRYNIAGREVQILGGGQIADLELEYIITDASGRAVSLEEALCTPGSYTITPKAKTP